jgi:hypothetical protein
LMLAGAVLGPIAEALNPDFKYQDPDFIGVPIWLPALYACITPALGQVARKVLGRSKEGEALLAHPVADHRLRR